MFHHRIILLLGVALTLLAIPVQAGNTKNLGRSGSKRVRIKQRRIQEEGGEEPSRKKKGKGSEDPLLNSTAFPTPLPTVAPTPSQTPEDTLEPSPSSNIEVTEEPTSSPDPSVSPSAFPSKPPSFTPTTTMPSVSSLPTTQPSTLQPTLSYAPSISPTVSKAPSVTLSSAPNTESPTASTADAVEGTLPEDESEDNGNARFIGPLVGGAALSVFFALAALVGRRCEI
jgi:hypothetical protein